jgi:hypothetical protein
MTCTDLPAGASVVRRGKFGLYNYLMPNAPVITEADILEEIVAPDQSNLSPEAARSLLALRFTKQATQRIRRLLRKNNQGTITATERLTLERFLRVGQFLDLVQAKARLSLQRAGEAP